MRDHKKTDREVDSRAVEFSSPASSAVSAALLSAIERALTPEQLDKAASDVWRVHGQELIADTEAQSLADRIESRRPKKSNDLSAFVHPIGKHTIGKVSRFKRRKRSKSPDHEASKARRRKFGGCGALPDTLRQFYSEGQRAILAIISLECRVHGACTLSVNEIGGRAGAGHTLVQKTLRQADRNGHIRVEKRPRRGQKHLTNRVFITAPDWRAWNKKYQTKQGGSGSTFVKEVGPTKNNYIKKKGRSKSESAERANPIKAPVTAAGPPYPMIGLGRPEGTPSDGPLPARCASQINVRSKGGRSPIILMEPPGLAQSDLSRVGGGRRID